MWWGEKTSKSMQHMVCTEEKFIKSELLFLLRIKVETKLRNPRDAV